MRLRDVSFLVMWRGWLGVVAACVGALVSVEARAQEVCYRWFNNDSVNGVVGQFFGSADALGAGVVAYRNAHPQAGGAGGGQYTSTYTFVSCEGSPFGPSGNLVCSYEQRAVPTGTGACAGAGGTVPCSTVFGGTFDASWDVDPAGCPPPPDEECEDIGKSKIVTGPPGSVGTAWCEGVCRWRVSFGMCPDGGGCEYVAEIVSSCGGAGPGGDPPEGPPEDVDDGGADPTDDPPESCVDIGDGEYCIGGSGPDQCGYFNDVYTCIDQVREDECKVAEDGSRLCGDQVKGTPPAPDNGTPGEVATPDGTVSFTDSNGNTTTYNYYSSGTVAGSSRDPGTTGANAASGAGSPHAPSQGDGDGDGQDDCEQTGACGGGEEIVSTGPCYDDGEGFVGVVSACVQEAFSYISEALYEENEWYELAISIADSVPSGGTCPSAEFSAWGESYDFGEVACDLIEDAEPTLGLMFLILWSFVALRILIGTFAEA